MFPIAVRIVGDVLLAALEAATARCPLTNDGFNGRAAAQFALEQAVQASASATPAAQQASNFARCAGDENAFHDDGSLDVLRDLFWPALWWRF